MKYILLYGNLSFGLQAVGKFKTEEKAREWAAKRWTNGYYQIMGIMTPKEYDEENGSDEWDDGV